MFGGGSGEELGDDFFQRRVLDADVFNRVAAQHVGQDVGDILALVRSFARGSVISTISP